MSSENFEPYSRPNPEKKRFIARMIISNIIILVCAGILALSLQNIQRILLLTGCFLLIVSIIIFIGGSSDPRTGTLSEKGGSYIPFTAQEVVQRLNKGTLKNTQDALRHALYTFPAAIILLILALVLYRLQ